MAISSKKGYHGGRMALTLELTRARTGAIGGVQELNLSDNAVSLEGAKTIAPHIYAMTSLSTLRLHNTGIGPSGGKVSQLLHTECGCKTNTSGRTHFVDGNR